MVQKYRWVNFLTWIFMIVGYGLLSTLREDSSTGHWVGFQVVVAAGIGLGVRRLALSVSAY